MRLFSPICSPSGHIIYSAQPRKQAGIWALPFDLDSLEARGEPFEVIQDATTPSLSDRGDLLVLDQEGIPLHAGHFISVDENGDWEERGQPMPRPEIVQPSPDGKRLLVSHGERGAYRLSVISTHLFGRPTLLIEDRSIRAGCWVDDDRIATGIAEEGQVWTWIVSAGNTGEPQRTVRGIPRYRDPNGGELVLYCPDADPSGLYRWNLREDASPELWLPGALNGRLSPDGRFLIYLDGEMNEYLEECSSDGTPTLLPDALGRCYYWDTDSEHVYFGHEGKMWRMRVVTEGEVDIGEIQPLFDLRELQLMRGWFALDRTDRDPGTRFLFIVAALPDQRVQARLDQGWAS